MTRPRAHGRPSAGTTRGAEEAPVRVKAHLVDPDTMTVVWMNEAAAAGFPATDGGVPEVPAEQVVPAPDAASARGLVREVATTGAPRHLRGDLASTRRGSLSMLTSLYRMPDGLVLVLTENAWLVEHGGASAATAGEDARPPRSQNPKMK